MTRPIVAACAALTLLAALSPGNAQPWFDQPQTMKVYYGDLDLSQRSDNTILLQRLQRASAWVCGGSPSPSDPFGQLHFWKCEKTAMDQAVAAIGTPLLADLYGNPQLAKAGPAADVNVAANE